jgi:hypothetical protein
MAEEHPPPDCGTSSVGTAGGGKMTELDGLKATEAA